MDDVDMEVERLIQIPSRGTVIVGTVVSGYVTVGEVYEFQGVRGRCEGIEFRRKLLPHAGPGSRVGVLLSPHIET